MSCFRFDKSLGIVVVINLLMNLSFVAESAADGCTNPSFTKLKGSPFTISPKPGVVAEPEMVAVGNFIKRSDSQRCDCDLAVTLSTPNAGFIALMRGNENGTFAVDTDSILNVDPNPVAIASGRFKQGSNLDSLVVVSRKSDGSGSVQLYLPNNNGTYQPPQIGPHSWPTGKLKKPVGITTGDFNADGSLDVAIANREDATLTVLLGTETGTFRPEPIAVNGLGGFPEALAAGKFSGNTDGGRDDIAMSIVENVGGSRRVVIQMVSMSGSGTFSMKPPVVVGEKNSFGSWIAAANLTAPPTGSEAGRFQDLVIAFTDRTPGQTAIGRIKVLLHSSDDNFDVTSSQIHDLGASPRSLKVSDIDDDGTVDLIVSTYSESASTLDGTVRFFKGKSGPIGSGGFFKISELFSFSETLGIRPKSLVTGRFGLKRSDGQNANIGLAAVNDTLNTVSVFLRNDQGAFSQPSFISTLLKKGDKLFATGDFHSSNGNSALQDLVYVSKVSGRNILSILLSNGAGGFGPPQNPTALSVGVDPQLIAAGNFDQEKPLDIAVVDAKSGDSEGRPLLKIFLGKGEGHFKLGNGISEFFLSPGEQPVAMVTGKFRGEQMPLDIAIASDTTPPSSTSRSGKLTVLLNNGNGEFAEKKELSLNFRPGFMATSNNLRAEKKFDLILRDADEKRFQFLINLGGAQFRPTDAGSTGFFGEVGDLNTVLIGDVAPNNTENKLDDIVTFDKNMITKVFVNDGSGVLRATPPTHIMLSESETNKFASPPYLLADFGEGKLGFTAAFSSNGKIRLASFKGDGKGNFTLMNNELELKPIDMEENQETVFERSEEFSLEVMAALAGRFRTTIHGNNKLDLGFATKIMKKSFTTNACPDDPRPPKPNPPKKVCHFTEHPLCERPGGPRPPCPTVEECVFVPQPPTEPICQTTQDFSPTFTVFGNTCGD